MSRQQGLEASIVVAILIVIACSLRAAPPSPVGSPSSPASQSAGSPPAVPLPVARDTLPSHPQLSSATIEGISLQTSQAEVESRLGRPRGAGGFYLDEQRGIRVMTHDGRVTMVSGMSLSVNGAELRGKYDRARVRSVLGAPDMFSSAGESQAADRCEYRLERTDRGTARLTVMATVSGDFHAELFLTP